MCGSKPSEVTELFAGDIGAIGKLTNTRTGDTLSVKGTPVSYAKTDYSVPVSYTHLDVYKRQAQQKKETDTMVNRTEKPGVDSNKSGEFVMCQKENRAHIIIEMCIRDRYLCPGI